MRKARKYDSYEDYIAFQKKKTTDPIRREKWLGEEGEGPDRDNLIEIRRVGTEIKGI